MLKLIKNSVATKLINEYKPKIWEKRGQTFEEYQKRDTSGIDKFIGIDPIKNPHIKKDEQPESIQTLKYKLRRIKGTSKFKHEGKLIKITSSLIRKLKTGETKI